MTATLFHRLLELLRDSTELQPIGFEQGSKDWNPLGISRYRAWKRTIQKQGEHLPLVRKSQVLRSLM